MWPLPLIIGVAVAGAVVLLVTGVFLAVVFERRRHDHIMRAHGLDRGLITYHRTNLSASGGNYSHVTPPTAYLRRSVQSPYGIVAMASMDNITPTDDEKEPHGNGQILHDSDTVLRPKDRGGARRFNGHSLLQIPKTRRQRRILKVIPLEQSQTSPLSAISEFTDSSTCHSPGVEEHLLSSAGLADSESLRVTQERHFSLHWPLSFPKTRSTEAAPTEVTSIAARASMLMRMGGGVRQTSPQPAMGPETRSMDSTAWSAPQSPLPALPTIDHHPQSRIHELQTRVSTTSLETVGSSVLGTNIHTPALAFSPDTAGMQFDLRTASTLMLQVPPAKQAIHGLCSGKPSIRSLHPIVDMNESTPEHEEDSPRCQPPQTLITRDDSFKTIDASQWDHRLPLRVYTTRIEGVGRHSMYESSQSVIYRADSNSAATDFLKASTASLGHAIQRPASVATANPLQWDRQRNFSSNRRSLSCLEGPTRGHRRQNCVRISNLPVPGRPPRLPQMAGVEEEHQTRLSTEERTGATVKVESSVIYIHSPPALGPAPTPTPSPFKYYPILTPSGRPVQQQHMDLLGSASSGMARPDSEIFNVALGSSSKYSYSPRQWPLSPTPRTNLRLDGTPPSAQHFEYLPFESPILPSPALKSASLYPRKSLVRGPRNPRPSGHAHGSPLQHKQGPNFRVAKDREYSGAGEMDLRRSVMMLRSMNSEGRLMDHHGGRGYRSFGGNNTALEDTSPGSQRTLTPPTSKRINGLRNSSGTPSTMSVSPSLDRTRFAPSPSPLTQASIMARQKREKTAAGSPPTHQQHQIAPSPSATSIGANSVWEDASVRGESPEPMPVPGARPDLEYASTPLHVAPLTVRTKPNVCDQQQHPSPLPHPSSRPRGLSQHHNFRSPNPQTPEKPAAPHFEPRGRHPGVHTLADDTENLAPTSMLVQNLERVASAGQWSHEGRRGLQGEQQQQQDSLGLGLGLGLHLGSSMMAGSG